jgi:hypothetical protein
MTTKSEMVEQSNLAFEFVQKLYLEVSYLIKELEGILYEEKEKYIIGRPSGYAVSSMRSTGLESTNVPYWLMKKLSVFFIPEDKTERKGGQTITPIDENLKVLYLRIILDDKNVREPIVQSGVLYNIFNKNKAAWITKFEKVMTHLEYNDDKVFGQGEKINYEDAYIKLKGDLIKSSLFEISSSEDIQKKIVEPSLRLFRKY